MKRKRLHLSDQDWMTLRRYAKTISGRIERRLPEDWDLPREDIESAVYDTFISLLANYRPGAMSPTSYCWNYAENITRHDLKREYDILKSQLQACDVLEYQDDEGNNHEKYHEVRKGDVDALSVDGRETVPTQIDVSEILEKATPEDRVIMEEIMAGHSLEDVAKKHDTNKMDISRKMRRYR